MGIKAITNWWTTILGIIAGVATYLYQLGPNWPTGLQGWGTLGIALIMIAWGVVQKDGATGSQPGATS